MALGRLDYNRIAADQLRVFLMAAVGVYSLLALSHMLLLPETIRNEMTLIALATSLCSVACFVFRKAALITEHAEHVIVALLALGAFNVIAHMVYTNELRQTTNFIVLLAIVGYMLPSMATYLMLLMSIVLTWLLIAFGIPDANGELVHYLFAMGLGIAVSLVLNRLRRQQVSQYFEAKTLLDELGSAKSDVEGGQRLFFSVLNTIPAAIVVRDSDSKTIIANDEAQRLFERDPSIQSGAGVEPSNLKIVSPDLKAFGVDQSPASRVVKGESIDNEIVGMQLPSGTTIWGMLNSFQVDVGSEQGALTLISFVDITSQFHEQMRLGESESRAYAILKSVGEGVIAVDGNEVIEVFNPAAEQITGYRELDALGKPLSSVFQVSLPAVTTSADFFTAGIKQGIVTNKAGEKVRVELQISRVSRAGQKQGWVYIFRDITEKLQAEEERVNLDKMRSVGVLAGGIAHDFNNLLASLYGNLSLVELNLESPSKAREFLNYATDSIDQARSLSNQLLTFARGNDPVLEKTDVEKLVRESAQFASSGGKFSLRFHVDPGDYTCEIDPGQIQQVINNLVLNAMQASDGEGDVQIYLSHLTVEGEEGVQISVADTGIGIEEEQLAQIFDPYYTTKSSGSGLGLATVHSIVIKHGGTINADSTVGEGTVFRVWLPLKENASDHAEAIVISDDDASTAPPLKVLVMDDEAPVLRMMTKLLEHLGHQSVGTEDGQAAIDAYAKALSGGNPYDLVIMDLTVAEGMGGREATAEILKIDPDAKIVVSSGYSSGAELANFEEHGFVARLPKPFRMADLESMIGGLRLRT